MKKIIVIIALIGLTACESESERKPQTPVNIYPVKQVEYKTVSYKKAIKDLKEVQEQYTDYHYKYDVWNGKFRQQPNVYTKSNYYVIYTDGSHEEISRDKWLGFSKGDSVTFVKQVPIN